MTKEYIMQIAFEMIAEHQSETRMSADKDSLLYLMAFNDGVIELALRLQEKMGSKDDER